MFNQRGLIMTIASVLSMKTAIKVMQWLDFDTGDYIWDRKNPDYDKEFLLEEIERFQNIEYSARSIATRIFDKPFYNSDYDELKKICSEDLFDLSIRYYLTSNYDT
jgi:hypothetical protein